MKYYFLKLKYFIRIYKKNIRNTLKLANQVKIEPYGCFLLNEYFPNNLLFVQIC